MEGSNLLRLRAAHAELAPGFLAKTRETGLYLLADYQEQLEQPQPDIELAASYLALVSTVPLNAARYRKINALLCVSATKVTAEAIQEMAERLRRQDYASLPVRKGAQK
ncbi:MAG: hypothetical protein B7X08_03200 [Acidocella sp. 20-63-7]|nr:MAG: hypothetical protein B7X08_03200 [Acidocella sp. 20-63-7]